MRKIYKVWTELFKGYYWETEENCVYDYYYDDDCDDVEGILDARTLRKLEQHNKNTNKFCWYPARIVAERFKLVDLTNEDLTALTQDILDDNDMLSTNYENIYYVKGDLYYFDENTEKFYLGESEGMISPVGYDPDDDSDDSDDC